MIADHSATSEGVWSLRTVCIAQAYGCPRAQVDVALMFRYFELNGWRVVRRIEDADLIIVDTCGVDSRLEEASLRRLSVVKRKAKNGSRLVVMGCLAGIDKERIEREWEATAIPPVQVDDLDDLIGATVKLRAVQDPNLVEASVRFAESAFRPWDKVLSTVSHGLDSRSLPRDLLIDLGVGRFLKRIGWTNRDYFVPDARTFDLRVARGCMGGCTYCAIRFAEGPLRSKPLADVLAEFDAGLAQGYREFRLVAGDLGCYGQDIGTNVVELLSALFSRDGDFRLCLLDFNPKYLIRHADELADLLSRNSQRIRLILIPLQSGSERILRLMGRGYGAAAARDCLRVLRRRLPDVALETHALVGFPGETEEDFAATVDALREIRFNLVSVYVYSDRPGTKASQLPDHVPDRQKRERAKRLRREFPHGLAPFVRRPPSLGRLDASGSRSSL